MRSVVHLTLGAAVLLATAAGAASSAGVQSAWTIRSLGTLGVDSQALAINDSGVVVGSSRLRRERLPAHAFLWQNGRMRDLGTLGRDLGSDLPNVSSAVAINDRGQVLGNSSVDQNSPVSHAFVWQAGRMTAVTTVLGPDSYGQALNERGQVVGWSGDDFGYGRGRAILWEQGRLRSLGALPGREHSWAYDVNERGVVVGESYSVDERLEGEAVKARAFLWRAGKLTDLGTLPGRPQSTARAINERGQVIGNAFTSGGASRAFLWQSGRRTDLGAAGERESVAVAINDRGQVIGFRTLPSGEIRGFVWQNGRRVDLRGLGGRETRPSAINNRGEVVGTSTTTGGAEHAVVWVAGRVTDLGTLGGRRSSAVAIDEHGRIVGSATTKAEETRAVLWTPRGG
jgi:probable HAF family extracellular repeat protein